MSYFLSGDFVEACDCTIICPCWLEEDPVGGHCTGLVAWKMDEGSMIDGYPVGGCKVVSIATHAGNRRDGSNTTSMLYVDVGDASTTGAVDRGDTGTSADAFVHLAQAFSGRADGPLADLAEVSGTVAGSERAVITIEGPAARGGQWRVVVRPEEGSRSADGNSNDACMVHAEGHPQVFEDEDEPLTLRHTALSRELGIRSDATAGAASAASAQEVVVQKGDHLFVNVGALPAGYLEVFDRSGMRGRFAYEYATDAGARAPRKSLVDDNELA